MDQLSAHLDRGWDLVQKGDAASAKSCAERALAVDDRNPEAHHLLGYVAQLEGEFEEALEHFRQAIDLDESYFEAMVHAAEILIHPMGAFDDAIRMCDDALDYAETDDELADCILLKVDAYLGKGELNEARRAMVMLPDGPFTSASTTFLVGRAFYETGDLDKAAELIERAAEEDPQHADAQYYLGLVRDDRGDLRGASEAFLRARALDLALPAVPWAPEPDDFATTVRAVFAKLDVLLARYVRELEVFIVDMPGAEVVVDGLDPRALLLLDRPRGEDGSAERGRLFVYQRNVERAAGSVEAIEEHLQKALEREITAVFLDQPNGESGDKHSLN
jgi:tetratricopeptide (TPR) repeat protein